MADPENNAPAPADPEENKGPEEAKDDQAPLLPAEPDKPAEEKPKDAAAWHKKKPPNDLNYAFLDGLRGFGALTVYLQHFAYELYPYFLYGRPEPGSKLAEDFHEPPTWLKITQSTPLHMLTNGSFWVCEFFILSGFVLTLRWFKVRNQSSIYGGVFRRYLRLALPLFTILQIYYLVAKTDCTWKDGTLAKVKQKKSYLEFLLDGTIGIWFGNNDYAYVTWTLSVELWATYYVFIVAQTVVFYRHRYILYIVVILFLWIPRISDDLHYTNYQFKTSENTSYLDCNLRAYIPYFTFGVIFADVENLRESVPLGALRDLHWGWKIPINLVLLFLFFTYGSMTMWKTCEVRDEDDCWWQDVTTFGTQDKIYWLFCTIGTLAGFIFALTSSWFQWVLETWPFWFLGKVSYTLYLFHLLVVKWGVLELHAYFYDEMGIDYDFASLYCFLIFTPVLFVVSWLLEMAIDTPSKLFAHAVDQIARYEKPKKKPVPEAEKKEGDEDKDEESRCATLLSEQWILWVIVGFTVVVCITTEVYGALNGNGERIRAMKAEGESGEASGK